MNTLRRLIFLGILMVAIPAAAEAIKLEAITVMALGPADGRAVVALPDGKMHVLKLGDTVPGSQAIVLQVLHDKLVVSETIEISGSPSVKQLVWIYKPAKAGGKSNVQRLEQTGPEQSSIQSPVYLRE